MGPQRTILKPMPHKWKQRKRRLQLCHRGINTYPSLRPGESSWFPKLHKTNVLAVKMCYHIVSSYLLLEIWPGNRSLCIERKVHLPVAPPQPGALGKWPCLLSSRRVCGSACFCRSQAVASGVCQVQGLRDSNTGLQWLTFHLQVIWSCWNFLTGPA